MGDKSVETLYSETRFSSVLDTFPLPSRPPSPFPPQTMLIFLFLRLHRPLHLHNIELGGKGMLDAIKIGQMLKYRKAFFVPKRVSTTFVTHCGYSKLQSTPNSAMNLELAVSGIMIMSSLLCVIFVWADGSGCQVLKFSQSGNKSAHNYFFQDQDKQQLIRFFVSRFLWSKFIQIG